MLAPSCAHTEMFMKYEEDGKDFIMLQHRLRSQTEKVRTSSTAIRGAANKEDHHSYVGASW